MTQAALTKPPRLFRPLTTRQFNALMKVIGRYRKEAKKCAKARAYYAACALVGAALEGIILALCCTREDDVEQYVAGLLEKKRPPIAVANWKFHQLLSAAKALKWFPTRKHKQARRLLGDWVHLVQELRNLIHPAMHVREHPTVTLKKVNWENAEEIFNVALAELESLNMDDLRRSMRDAGMIPLE